MKFCMPHWNELREAIKERGLSHLVAKDGKVAAQAAADQIRGMDTDYDPLMSAHWMISGRALECFGLALMTAKPDGTDYCPLCEVDYHEPGMATKWITGCTDSVLKHCQEKKLVPPNQ